MNFTFGIITNKNTELVDKCIFSIFDLKIPEDKFEIIIVGGHSNYKRNNIKAIPFEELQYEAWITKKKNIITQNAKFDNIVYQHDYVAYDKNWYISFLEFGDKFDICMSKVLTQEGQRYRDWCFYAGYVPQIPISDDIKKEMFASGNWYLPYEVTNVKNLKKYMYISGAYWIAKKQVMVDFPLNENLYWGKSEDIEWTTRVVTKYDLSLNSGSIVRLIKEKGPLFCEIEKKFIPILEAV